jgi:hypothetical protein
MEKTIRLRINKELKKEYERKIMNLKGSLISGGYTDIIHIDDEDELHHINFFTTERRDEALELILTYIEQHTLAAVVILL